MLPAWLAVSRKLTVWAVDFNRCLQQPVKKIRQVMRTLCSIDTCLSTATVACYGISESVLKVL
jgi:hypothetical protein